MIDTESLSEEYLLNAYNINSQRINEYLSGSNVLNIEIALLMAKEQYPNIIEKILSNYNFITKYKEKAYEIYDVISKRKDLSNDLIFNAEELKQIAKEPYSSHEEFNNNLIGYF